MYDVRCHQQLPITWNLDLGGSRYSRALQFNHKKINKEHAFCLHTKTLLCTIPYIFGYRLGWQYSNQ